MYKDTILEFKDSVVKELLAFRETVLENNLDYDLVKIDNAIANVRALYNLLEDKS